MKQSQTYIDTQNYFFSKADQSVRLTNKNKEILLKSFEQHSSANRKHSQEKSFDSTQEKPSDISCFGNGPTNVSLSSFSYVDFLALIKQIQGSKNQSKGLLIKKGIQGSEVNRLVAKTGRV